MSTTTTCAGLPADRLSTYLAAIGLAKVVSRADSQCRFGWNGLAFSITSTVEDLAAYLLREYAPSPIVSPWNGGSGFGHKDLKQSEFLDRIVTSKDDRLAVYGRTIEVARDLMDEAVAAGWDKPRIVRELRNRAPDDALDWLDAAVVLGSDDDVLAFPILTGTGGNDGRLEFSSNFHQRLADVLPALGANEAKSLGWARDTLEGTATIPAVKAAFGMYDPVGAGGPNSSAHGAADSRVNPWLFVLMIEGVSVFASGAAKRFGEWRARGATPFTVPPGVGGLMPDAPEEESRGEFWAPLVQSCTFRQFTQMTREARSTWDGRTVASATQMYGAVRTFGVDRGITAFHRFTFGQLNGLAFSAVLRDRVRVSLDPSAELLALPMRRAEALASVGGAGTARQYRLFNRTAVAFLSDPSPAALVVALAALTRLEVHATASEASRESIRRNRPAPQAAPVVQWITTVRGWSPELRLAASMASAHARTTQGESVRSLLMWSQLGTVELRKPVVAGLLTRPVVDLMADVVVWAAQHQPLDRGEIGVGFRPLEGHRFGPDANDAHRWVDGSLNTERLHEALLAMLALDWRFASYQRPHSTRLRRVVPALALLQPFVSNQVVLPGYPPTDDDASRQGLNETWPLRLRAGRVSQVLDEARAVLMRNQALVVANVEKKVNELRAVHLPGAWSPALTCHVSGPQLLAALTPEAGWAPLRHVAHLSPSPQIVVTETVSEGESE